jgi:hydrogenase maturation protease
MEMSENVVLGLGNVLLGDDGAGIHVVKRLKAKHSLPEEVALIDGGTLSFTLLEIVEAASALIVVDAMELDGPAGQLETFIDDELDTFLAAPVQRNVHDLNLGDLLRMCALRDKLPAHRALIGIQPESIEWSDKPSAAVSEGIDVACDTISELIREWAHDNE